MYVGYSKLYFRVLACGGAKPDASSADNDANVFFVGKTIIPRVLEK